MPIMKDPKEVRKIFDWAKEGNVCLAAFATENQHTTEAILKATHESGKEYKIKSPRNYNFPGNLSMSTSSSSLHHHQKCPSRL